MSLYERLFPRFRPKRELRPQGSGAGWGARVTMHANDEYAEIKTLYNGARLLEQYLKDYDAIA